jgi:hypothetical protein
MKYQTYYSAMLKFARLMDIAQGQFDYILVKLIRMENLSCFAGQSNRL